MSNKNYDFGRCVYICSKPLQFFHLLAITKHYGIRKPKVYIVTKKFSGWEDFKESILKSEFYNVFSEINFLPSYNAVCDLVIQNNYDSLFIDDDRVSLYFSFVTLKQKNMIVFEEGFGTYCSDLPKRLSWIKRVKWVSISLIKGCGLNFGGGRCTDYVLIQYPLVYKKLNKLSSFKALEFSGVYDIFSGYNSFWDRLISKDMNIPFSYPSDSKAALVLGTWGGANTKEVEEICNKYDLVIYKSHPHDDIFLNSDKVHNLESKWVPAEVYMYRLADKFDNLHVYHYSSSTCLYLDKIISNVEITDLLKDSRFVKVQKAKKHFYNSCYI